MNLSGSDAPAIAVHPAPVAGRWLLEFLRHKGSPWIEDVERRATGGIAGSRDYFLTAEEAGQPIAHVWYTVAQSDPRLGLLGHVFTRPEHRRRGLASRLMTAAMEHFCAAGGRVMQLFTDTPEARQLYERHDFRAVFSAQVLHERDWSMRGPAGNLGEVDAWLRSEPCSVRELREADLPQYCLLYNLEYDTLLKDRAQGIGLGLETEWVFIRTLRRLARGRAACRVLHNGATIVGLASLMPSEFAHQSHVALFDYYVHPRFAARAVELAEVCLTERARLGVEFVYALAADAAKQTVFEQLGLRRRAELPGHLRVDGRAVDCALYGQDR